MRVIGVLLATGAGRGIGMVVKLAAMPADPMGTFTSPLCGAFWGLFASLFILVVKDWQPNP